MFDANFCTDFVTVTGKSIDKFRYFVNIQLLHQILFYQINLSNNYFAKI